MVEITKEKFKSYVEVQKSGKVNMLMITRVCELSKFKLNSDEVLEIIENYSVYAEKYPDVKWNE